MHPRSERNSAFRKNRSSSPSVADNSDCARSIASSASSGRPCDCRAPRDSPKPSDSALRFRGSGETWSRPRHRPLSRPDRCRNYSGCGNAMGLSSSARSNAAIASTYRLRACNTRPVSNQRRHEFGFAASAAASTASASSRRPADMPASTYARSASSPRTPDLALACASKASRNRPQSESVAARARAASAIDRSLINSTASPCRRSTRGSLSCRDSGASHGSRSGPLPPRRRSGVPDRRIPARARRFESDAGIAQFWRRDLSSALRHHDASGVQATLASISSGTASTATTPSPAKISSVRQLKFPVWKYGASTCQARYP